MLALAILMHLLCLLTNFDMSGGDFLSLLALLAKLVIPNVTINRICQFVKLVQQFNGVLHEMKESPKVKQLWDDFKP
jgi:hypothetical protein